jgi:hypothetical protein
MEKEEFFRKVNNILININKSMILISEKIIIINSNIDKYINLLQQSRDVNKYINIIKNLNNKKEQYIKIEKDLNIINKSLQECYVFVNTSKKEDIDENIDNCGIENYYLQFEDINIKILSLDIEKEATL